MRVAVCLLGLAVFLGISWAASTARKAVRWRIVAWGMGLQVLFALLILQTGPGEKLFDGVSRAFTTLIGYTDAGGKFVWGPLYKQSGGFTFFIDALMPILFFSALMSLLYHLGVMQAVVAGIAWVMRRTMGTSGSETLSASANIFVGQTEAPLVVKPFLDTMTKSELHAVMVGGFATVAGGVMAAYVNFGIDPGHLVAASFMSAPAALVVAKLFHPETEESVTAGALKVKLERTTANVFDAACVGAADGMKLALNVAAMIVAFVSIIALLNGLLGWAHGLFEDTRDPVTLQRIFGWILAPVAWLMGVPWADCRDVGGLLGTRMVLNEFVAYLELMKLDRIGARGYVVATYAFCGFANFASIAIQIGGIGALVPARRQDLARLGLRAMLAGTIASFLTANVANAVLTDAQVERDFRWNRARVAPTRELRDRELKAFLDRFGDSPYAERFRAKLAE